MTPVACSLPVIGLDLFSTRPPEVGTRRVIFQGASFTSYGSLADRGMSKGPSLRLLSWHRTWPSRKEHRDFGKSSHARFCQVCKLRAHDDGFVEGNQQVLWQFPGHKFFRIFCKTAPKTFFTYLLQTQRVPYAYMHAVWRVFLEEACSYCSSKYCYC